MRSLPGTAENEVQNGRKRGYACDSPQLYDDEATVIMVDTNIQREDILPSEKARAYAMKYEAMKHQGRKGKRKQP